ncbi:MAG: CAAX prenyl protease-related protein [Pirellulales bacterium]|nr:CAAX prenyl protease-related protein [Pirellulales bacterium]
MSQAETPAVPPPRLRENPWLVFLLPFVVYMLVQSLEPTAADKPGGAMIGLAIAYQYYPIVYTAKIVLTLVAVVFVLPGYRQFPWRISPLSIVVGVVGVALWVGLSKLGLEQRLLEPLGLGKFIDLGARAGYNPLDQLADSPAWAWGFLAVRVLGMAVVVALIEEFFLRGFVMRFVMEKDWWKVPFGTVTPAAVVAGTVVPMLCHPAELLAAAVWFSMVTWLMVRTRNIWDCVAAHAVTNFLLALYVILADEWQFM